MKKLFLCLITALLFSNLSFCQKAKLIDAKGNELAVIINIDETNSFKEYYIFQYSNKDFSEISTEKDASIIEINKEFIKIKVNNDVVILTINTNYKNENEKIYFGYGLSKRLGNFSLIKDYLNPTSIINIVLVNNVLKSKGTCHSGGAGATECSVTPSNISVGTPSCSVKCGTGYHACCDDTKGECNCVVNKPVKHLAPY